jgi:hypothetical protein
MYLCTNIMFLDIIIILFILQNNVSETGFCRHLQLKPTQLGPINRASPYLRTECIYVFHMILRINNDHSLNSINWLVFVMEMSCVSHEVEVELFLNFM